MQYIIFGSKTSWLRMRDVRFKLFSWFLFLLFVNFSVLEALEKANSVDPYERDDNSQETLSHTVENLDPNNQILHNKDKYPKEDTLGSSEPPGKSNETTEDYNNETIHSTVAATKPTTPAPPTPKPILPVQTGVKAQEEEQSSGLTIFFSLLVIGGLFFIHFTDNDLTLAWAGMLFSQNICEEKYQFQKTYTEKIKQKV
ncbi:hypothetical protein ILYODFUR_023927 [Ilyodon furcidens]|uniref:Uncharacterized protein n=1 Tax=Ilyodon furcidens TaxID=33524 RepID=A0ABV0U7W9_9TELE